METGGELKKAVATARVLHLAFMAAPLIYPVLALAVFPALGVGGAGDAGIGAFEWALAAVLAMVAVVLVVFGAPVLTRVTLKQAVAQGTQPPLAGLFLQRSALYEAIAVFGLVLALIGVPWYAYLLFFAASFALLAASIPSEEKARELLRQAQSTGL